jgi:hypothetical protein
MMVIVYVFVIQLVTAVLQDKFEEAKEAEEQKRLCTHIVSALVCCNFVSHYESVFVFLQCKHLVAPTPRLVARCLVVAMAVLMRPRWPSSLAENSPE